jgi:GTP-binding protein
VILPISAQSGEGLQQLKYAVKDAVQFVRSIPIEAIEEAEIPILTLVDTSDEWNVSKDGDRLIVRGQKIEQFGRRTDFSNEEGVQRLRHIMRRMGIMHELRRQKVEAGQTIQVGGDENHTFTF